MSLKEIFDLPYFHGRLTDEEAYNLCQEELTNTGKTQVFIWHLSEINGELHGKICDYHRNSEVSFVFPYPTRGLSQMPLMMPFMDDLRIENFVERKNPLALQELARVAILDSLDYFCLKHLIQRIDELQLPAMEKEELKKLVRGFRVLLALKVPNPNEL